MTYEYLVGYQFPPVLVFCKWADGSPSSTLPVATRTVWIDSVNSMTQVKKIDLKTIIILISIFIE